MTYYWLAFLLGTVWGFFASERSDWDDDFPLGVTIIAMVVTIFYLAVLGVVRG